MYHRTSLAGAARTWMAKSPRGDDPLVRRSPRWPTGHPLGSERPLEFVVLPQQSRSRGCDPRRSRALSREMRASSPTCLRLSSARRSLDLSIETGASSPARRRLSSTRRSSVGADLTEGERTDADASCWCWDDRGLVLVEPECAMPSRRSTSSRHYFMAPREAVELGGWCNNSLAADRAPGTALDVLYICAAVCCCVECTAPAALGVGMLVGHGV
jgi:hypothetical protein